MPYRLMFKFWMNMGKTEEIAIADQIELLKNDRLFTATIRDGIRLICDLRAGRLDVLLELYPWVRQALGHSANGHTNGATLTPLAAIDSRVEDDEEDIQLEMVEVSDGSSAQNFLNSMANLLGAE